MWAKLGEIQPRSLDYGRAGTKQGKEKTGKVAERVLAGQEMAVSRAARRGGVGGGLRAGESMVTRGGAGRTGVRDGARRGRAGRRTGVNAMQPNHLVSCGVKKHQG